MREPIDSFLNYLAVEKGYSEHTIDAYHNDLYGLAKFASEEASKRSATPSWADFSRQSMLSYLLDLKERGYVATTITRFSSANLER